MGAIAPFIITSPVVDVERMQQGRLHGLVFFIFFSVLLRMIGVQVNSVWKKYWKRITRGNWLTQIYMETAIIPVYFRVTDMLRHC